MPVNAVILDANLLVLLVVGLYSRPYIARHKRLAAYSEKDFDLLSAYVASASRLIVTPNTVTETSNLAGQTSEPARGKILKVLGKLLHTTTTEELYIDSKFAAEHPAFPRLGLTDSVLLNVADEGRTLLTADLDLYLAALRHGQSAVNFNHYIEANRP